MKDVITAPQTGAHNSMTIEIGQRPDYFPAFPFTLYLLGEPSGDDQIKIQYHDGDDWRDTAWVLNADTPVLTIYGPLDFRTSKGSTTAALGVAISKVRSR